MAGNDFVPKTVPPPRPPEPSALQNAPLDSPFQTIVDSHPSFKKTTVNDPVLRNPLNLIRSSNMPDPVRKKRPSSPNPGGGGEEGGPSEPKVEKPNTDDLLRRMRKVDPDQARRYRQRTGE